MSTFCFIPFEKPVIDCCAAPARPQKLVPAYGEALVDLAERPSQTGIHHIAGAGSCAWNELAIEVFDGAGVDCRVLPTTSDAFPRPAPRPAYSVLGSERARPLTLAPWQEGVAHYLAKRGASPMTARHGSTMVLIEPDPRPSR